MGRLTDELADALEDMCEREHRAAMKLKYFLGLDLGQATEFSALAVLEMQGTDARAAEFHCRHLQRWQLRTPYSEIAAETVKIVHDLDAEAAPVLAVDQSGTGPPVLKLIREAFDPAGAPRVDIEAIQLTAGDEPVRDYQLTRVPKRDLVSTAQLALQAGRLKIARGLRHAPTLERELMNFKATITLGGGDADAQAPWREGAHDDLVFAVCLALWTAQHGMRKHVVWA